LWLESHFVGIAEAQVLLLQALTLNAESSRMSLDAIE
jgi:hypothetical protein